MPQVPARQAPQDVEEYIGLGGTAPTGAIGEAEFDGHDHSKAWDDQGMAKELAGQFEADMKAAHAEQAKMAVKDYVGGAFMRTVPIQGHLAVMMDASNAQVKYAKFWHLFDMMLDDAQRAFEMGDMHLIEVQLAFADKVASRWRQEFFQKQRAQAVEAEYEDDVPDDEPEPEQPQPRRLARPVPGRARAGAQPAAQRAAAGKPAGRLQPPARAAQATRGGVPVRGRRAQPADFEEQG